MQRAAALLGALGVGAALGVRFPGGVGEQPATPLTRAEAWWQRRQGARRARAGGSGARQWPEGSPAYGGQNGDFVYPVDMTKGNVATPTDPPPQQPFATTTQMGTPWDYSEIDPITGLPKTNPVAHPDWPGGFGGGADVVSGAPGAPGVGAVGGEAAGTAGLPGAGAVGGEAAGTAGLPGAGAVGGEAAGTAGLPGAAGAPFPGGGGVGGAAGDTNQEVAGGYDPFGMPPAMTTTDVGQGGHVFRDPLNDYVIDQPNYIEEYTWPEFYKEVMDETSGTAEPIVEDDQKPPPTPMATTSHPMLTTQSPAHAGPGQYDREAARVPKWLAQAASGAGAAEAEAEPELEAEAGGADVAPGPAAMLQLAAETRGGHAPPNALDDPGRDWVDEMMRRLDPVSS